MRASNKDESVFRMLESERSRCVRVVEKICGELEKLPKGSLGQRKVKRAGKEYIYPCLRYRDDSGVKFEHLSPEQAEGLKPALDRRKKLRADLKATRKRLATLDALLRRGKGHENSI
ncbi:hypothetical protein [Geobacter anodireducens]